MTLSDVLQDKSKLIVRISKLFDKRTIEKICSKHEFIQRKRVLRAMDFFFFVCLLINVTIPSALKVFAGIYCNEE